ncbi:PAS domain S-box protein [[Phormidium] sp. ETS-05]|uniref:PAS domain S-box protein n=1 Tax=[Phormidium] sp. ETS-05 TaxID=222819 RepID=UPI0018EED53C|nr:PAS domain S-box protein [[Phormidium] sp. ETS-05]
MQATGQIQEYGQLFYAIFNTISEAIIIANDEAICVEANPAALNLLGVNRSQLIGRFLSEFTEPGWDFRSLWRTVEPLNQQRTTGEIILRRPDGTSRQKPRFSTNSAGGRIDSPSETRFLAFDATANFIPGLHMTIFRDITESKQTEITLEESQRLFQHMTEISPNFIYMYDLIKNCNVYANSQCQEIIGLTVEEIQAMGAEFLPTMMHPEDAGRLPEMVQRFFTAKDGEILESEFRIKAAGGKWIWLGCREVVFSRSPNGFPAQILGSAQDITAIKEAQEALKKANAELEKRVEERTALLTEANAQLRQEIKERRQIEASLRESEARFRAIFEQAAVGIARCGLDGNIIAINQKFADILGYERGEIIGKYHKEITLNEDLMREEKHKISLLAEAIDYFSIEKRYIHQNGEHIWVKLTVSLERDASGQASSLIGIVEDISVEKQVQAALEKSEGRYRSLVSAMSEGVVFQDAKGKIITCNQAALNILGLSLTEILGSTSFDSSWRAIREDGMPFPGEEHPAMVTLRTGQPCSNVIMGLEKSDGAIVWISINSEPVLSPDGNLDGVVTSFTNITKRKLDENILRRQEAQLEAIVNNIYDALLIVDADGIIRFVNPAAMNLFARDRDLLISQKLGLPLSDTAEISIVQPSGETRVGEMKVTSVDWEGENAFLISLRDITQRRQAELKLRQTSARLEYLLSSSPSVIYTCPSDSLEFCTFISDNVRELTGYQPESFLTEPDFWATHIHPEDAPNVFAQLHQLANLGHLTLEYRFLCQDNKYRWLRDEVKLLLEPRTDTGECIGSLIDITTAKLAEEEVIKALELERELTELKSRFISMTSHEFRTPLAVIKSSAQILHRYDFPREDQLEEIEQILSSVDRMTQLLEDVLFLGKAEAGKMGFNPTRFDLREFCQTLCQQIQASQSVNLNLSLGCEIDCGYTHVTMDEKRLWQILSNLLSNAIKYSPEGGEVNLTVTCQGEKVIFEISDQGIGIPPSDQAHLFESFHRGGNVGAIPGTGLGLAIVKKSVDLHRGTITCTSSVGMGTKFTVTLPLHAGNDDEENSRN